MKKLVLVPHWHGSRSVRMLADRLTDKLGYKVWRVTPENIGRRIALHFGQGTDKLTQLQRFLENGIPTLDFTADRHIASDWLPDTPVVCRTLLRGSEGKGIVVAETPEQLVQAPLYTKYFKKKKEFRVHVFNGKAFDVQEKRKRRDVDVRDTRIRNTANGYVFCRDGVVEPEGLRDVAVRAANALGYKLTGVDIGWNEHRNQLVVFEANSNPGLEGRSLDNYADAIIEWVGGQNVS